MLYFTIFKLDFFRKYNILIDLIDLNLASDRKCLDKLVCNGNLKLYFIEASSEILDHRMTE